MILFIISCEKQPTIPTILVEKVYDGSAALECVYFTDANNGYAGGDDGIILVTHNGGKSWALATLSGGENARFTCISFPAHDTGWISGRENQSSINTGPALYKTINGGISWQSVGTSYDMEFTHFPSVTVGYRDHYTDEIEKTTNGGQNWNSLSSSPYAPFSYQTLYFVNEDTGFVGTENGEFRTVNGGASWSTVNFPSYTL
ncbi:MAG TPA: YCF48-related protein, partial [Bacteroidia bacterium]|nr:YCF48-related protein [Bacteroidia bacterium]